jgi:hypothetical protein
VPELDPHSLGLAIRWAHVGAMAVALGGAVLVAALAFSRTGGHAGGLLAAAAGYERLFWAAAGVLVMTGVGNLGGFGRGIPAPGSEWGAALIVKLWAVAALLGVSLPRTLAVVRLGRAEVQARTASALRGLYGTTVVILAAIVLVAEVLAH